MTNGLPVCSVKEEFLEAIKNHQVVLLTGSTGSGKTTQIPQWLLQAGLAEKGSICCAEPRRIAAIAAATRVAEEVGCELGKEVGYHIRFERKLSDQTKLKFVTTGMLLRELIPRHLLQDYSAVIIDEAHERNLLNDFLFGYLKQVCKQRPEFKLIIMSATLDSKAFMAYFPNPRLITISEERFPVSVQYKPTYKFEEMKNEIEALVRHIHQLFQRVGGNRDTLIFLPGSRDIKHIVRRIQALNLPNLLCLPLYSRLTPDEQRKVFEPFDGMKVIVSTNVAESSITIDGIKYVIDSGLAKVEGFDSDFNVETLETHKISQSEAIQRTGRAGRTGPGTCFRLYSEVDFCNNRQYSKAPDISRLDLTTLVLLAKYLNANFGFITQPPTRLWKAAEAQLWQNEAIDENGKITEHGRNIARFPIQPKLAQLILKSIQFGCVEEAITIASMLEVGDDNIFVSPSGDYNEPELERVKEKFRDSESDFFTLLNIWDDYKKTAYSGAWCETNYISPYWMKEVLSLRDQLIAIAQKLSIPMYSNKDRETIGEAILIAFRQNLLNSRDGKNYSTENGLTNIWPFYDSVLENNKAENAVSFSLRGKGRRVFAYYNHVIPQNWLAGCTPLPPVPQAFATVSNGGACVASRKTTKLNHKIADVAVVPLTSEKFVPEPKAKIEIESQDRLLDSFLKKSISEVGLTEATQMKLLAAGFDKVEDIVGKTMEQFAKELRAVFTNSSQHKGNKGMENTILEAQALLTRFGLVFKVEKKKFKPQKTLPQLEMSPIDEEKAAAIIGKQFPLFKKFRESSGREKIDARNAIIDANNGLITRWARIYASQIESRKAYSIDYEDLWQEGAIGLMRAVETFDYNMGFRFSTYAEQWVRQTTGRALFDQMYIIRIPIHMVETLNKYIQTRAGLAKSLGRAPLIEEIANASKMSVTKIEQLFSFSKLCNVYSLDLRTKVNDEDVAFGAFITDHRSVAPINVLIQSEMKEVIGRILEIVPVLEVEKQCLELYFGLNDVGQHTLKEIGNYMGLSGERIRQILERVLTRLRTTKVWDIASKYVSKLSEPSLNNKRPQKSVLQVGDKVKDLCYVRQFVGDIVLERHEASEEEIQKVIDSIAKIYEFPPQKLLEAIKKGELVHVRRAIIYQLKDGLDMGFQRIGELINQNIKNTQRDYKAIKSDVIAGKMPLGAISLFDFGSETQEEVADDSE